MATDPIDGDVWIATNSGITRYSLASDTWTNYTVADGLSSNDVYAIAFDSRGNLYAGTLCDGLCIGSRESQYREWRVVHADKHISNDAQGDGFPSEKINDVLVSRQDVVYVGTCHGLAWSFDKGVHWRFLRGEDWSSNLTHSEVDPNRDSASVCAIEVFPGGNVTEEQSTAKHITIECGNLSKGSANGDRYFQDGSAGTTNNSISLDGVAGAAPEYIYHHGRFGPEFSYLIPNLEHGATYTVRLHFISVSDAKKSPPIFNIDINDMRKLASFDPYELCGNSLNHALVEDIVVHANDEGKIRRRYAWPHLGRASKIGNRMSARRYDGQYQCRKDRLIGFRSSIPTKRFKRIDAYRMVWRRAFPYEIPHCARGSNNICNRRFSPDWQRRHSAAIA
jgi:hypothetical protein